MSAYKMERDFQEMRLGDNASRRQPYGSQSHSPRSPHLQDVYPPQGIYGDTLPNQVPTFIRMVDPAYASPPKEMQRSPKQNYSYASQNSPPPPRYPQVERSAAVRWQQESSPPRSKLSNYVNLEYKSPRPSEQFGSHRTSPSPTRSSSSSAYRVESPTSYRPPSPFQERRDLETAVPEFSFKPPAVTSKYPDGAPSKILYTAPVVPPSHGFVQSRPSAMSSATNDAGQGTSDGFSSASQPKVKDPRPYQLKPTLDTYRGDTASVPSYSQPAGQPGREAEVDALTSLLMQNMEASADPDFFGICASCGHHVVGQYNGCAALDRVYHISCFTCIKCGMCAKCGQPIKGETAGCTALDQLFHVECFTCVSCAVGLKGQQFFAMEGKPYCESCYLNTLEKCSVCSKPITDRILRATGKPYHPGCFTCVVCGMSLDSVPFTVDATSQIHCIEDFHKKFAPKCCSCGLPIIPEVGQQETVRIVAMDKSFHVNCYTCEDCGLVLSSESDGRGCYPLDDHILCKSCNAKRIQAMTTNITTDL